jgi:DNA-binding NarL/FixJ family response regulator
MAQRILHYAIDQLCYLRFSVGGAMTRNLSTLCRREYIMENLAREKFPAPSAELMHWLFGLTPTEVKIARYIACGYGVAEIAAITRTGICSVKTHLRSISGKVGVGVHRQAHLAAVLVNLAYLEHLACTPSMLSPPRTSHLVTGHRAPV